MAAKDGIGRRGRFAAIVGNLPEPSYDEDVVPAHTVPVEESQTLVYELAATAAEESGYGDFSVEHSSPASVVE